MREPLKPFSFGAPYNLNPTTKEYSRPEDVFDYQAHFNYEYDKLELQGSDVARIQDYLNECKVGNSLAVFFSFSLSFEDLEGSFDESLPACALFKCRSARAH